MEPTLITQTRQRLGLSLITVARAVEVAEGTLSRIERGIQIPKRPLARRLFEYYRGAVPLGTIYDPCYVPPESTP